jgi:hypothetical protein
MRRHLATLAAALLAAAATAGLALAEGDGGADPRPRADRAFAVGLWGDLPYTEEQRRTGVPNLVADMNRQRLAFSVFDGDIKNGSSRCDDSVYAEALGRFDALSAPAVYVPGDNEWTDCHRTNNGGYDPLERLAHLRRVFYPSDRSLGQRQLRLAQQPGYPENSRWTVGGVVFAGLHVVGSDNNRVPDPTITEPNSARTPEQRVAAQREFEARDAAVRAWLRETFDEAARTEAPAVMLVIQANPEFDSPDTSVDERAPSREDGFSAFHRALRAEVLAFGRPVLLVHGDSHYFRIDKPMVDEGTPARRVERFTRLETFGERDPHWVKVIVDPASREVFSFAPQIVPANVVARTG